MSPLLIFSKRKVTPLSHQATELSTGLDLVILKSFCLWSERLLQFWVSGKRQNVLKIPRSSCPNLTLLHEDDLDDWGPTEIYLLNHRHGRHVIMSHGYYTVDEKQVTVPLRNQALGFKESQLKWSRCTWLLAHRVHLANVAVVWHWLYLTLLSAECVLRQHRYTRENAQKVKLDEGTAGEMCE